MRLVAALVGTHATEQPSAAHEIDARDGYAAIAADLHLLARLHDREPDAPLLAGLRRLLPQHWFALELDGDDWRQGCAWMSAALDTIESTDEAAVLDELAAEYSAIYLTYAYRTAPSESPWRDADGLERQGPMFAVRRWYQQHGVKAPDWRLRPDDHLVHELEFLAVLFERGQSPGALDDAARFMQAHPMTWVPAFCQRISARSALPFYAGLALLTHAYLRRLGEFLTALTGLSTEPPPADAESAQGASGPSCASPSTDVETTPYVPGTSASW